MQVVIPMAGAGERFRRAGYDAPKPLLDVAGVPLIERLVAKFPADWSFVFIANHDHLRDTPLRSVLQRIAPNARIVAIDPHKLGPVHSVLAGAEGVDPSLPTIVNYCDFSFVWDPEQFLTFTRRTRCDGAIVCYRGFHPHYLGNTLYAYCREEGGRVLEVREKGHFTPDRTQEWASSGTYFFRSGALALESFRRARDENLAMNGEFYVSLVYNPMIQRNMDIRVFGIPQMLQWGTPEDLEDYLYWHRAFDGWSQNTGGANARLLMPMAGLGTRFRGYDLPKPLIPVLGEPMYRTARRFLPADRSKPVVIARGEVADEVQRTDASAVCVRLEAPTQGQADTTLHGVPLLEADKPVLVSACDHGLLWDAEAWSSLMRAKPDVVVIGQRGYPEARRRPNAFSYIDADKDGRVNGVSVKKPLTAHPQREPVLVGTFWFARGALLKEGIDHLIQNDVRTNGERYLDAVVAVLADKGFDVRCFESRAFLNWGSPEALQEFDYWHRYFQGVPA